MPKTTSKSMPKQEQKQRPVQDALDIETRPLEPVDAGLLHETPSTGRSTVDQRLLARCVMATVIALFAMTAILVAETVLTAVLIATVAVFFGTVLLPGPISDSASSRFFATIQKLFSPRKR